MILIRQVLDSVSSVMESLSRSWHDPLDRFRNRRDMLGRGAAATADDVHEPAAGELSERRAGVRGLLVVLTKGVWKAGIRIAADVAVGDPRQLRDVRPHVARAERAVDADAERPRVGDRDPEGVDGLT